MLSSALRQFSILILCLSVVGCGTTTGESRGDGTPETLSLKKLRSDRYIDPILQVPGWPFDDGDSQYRLYWNGGDSKLPLFEQPNPESKFLGEASYGQGQEIQTAGDFIAVYQPATFSAKRSLELGGVVHDPGSSSHGADFSRRLARGDSVSVYVYSGKGNCYLGVAGRTIVGPCPIPEDFVGSFEGPSLAAQMQPVTKIWWVYISTPLGAGWLPLDDRVLADILPLSVVTDRPVVRVEEPVKDPAVDTIPLDDPKTDASVDSGKLDLESDLFGDEDSEQSQETSGSMGAALLTDEEIADRLDAKDDTLALGAYSLVQLRYDILEDCDGDGHQLQMPTMLDVYLDAQPNDRVRAYARGRITANFTQTEDSSNEGVDAYLDQLWLKFDVARVAFVTIGKQRLKWGTGRFWNPTDFVNSLPLDALNVNVIDTRLGVTMGKVHIPVESLGWNFYAIGTVDNAGTPYDIGAAARAEFLFDTTEIALSAAYKRNQAKRFGFDLSTGFWLLEFRLEGALLMDDPQGYYQGEFDLPALLPDEISRADDLIPQAVAGFEMQIPYRRGDLFVIGGEGFFNDAGYEDESLYPWMAFNNVFRPFYAGRIYAGGFAGLMGPGSWDDTNMYATVLANISDGSNVARVDVSQTVHRYLKWNLFANYHFGSYGEFRYELQIEPNIFAPEGVDIIAPSMEVGAGLELAL